MLQSVVEAAARYTTILEPDENTPEWWAGAPSVVRDPRGVFHLAARMREGNSPRGRRGYEIRILRSHDGLRFDVANRLTREDAGAPGFERPALAFDDEVGRFRLYGCRPLDAGWSIIRFDDADDPADFRACTASVVLSPSDTADRFPNMRGYKDPFITRIGGLWHMFVIGYDAVERAFHLVSDDGDAWRPAADRPVLENAGWHDYYTRPACLLPLGDRWLLVYEGSDFACSDPAYNIATGLAVTEDLQTFRDLTPDAPLLTTTTPGDYRTWRYSHWLPVDDRIYVYFEAARPNNTNEIRAFVIDAAQLKAAI